ncbi:MAG: hypothetical protein LBL23_04165 [Coriobacteriales bacterium]|jgi:hypothetical protein|nr:hypothetical protein [Coriobacteriales bacterium]
MATESIGRTIYLDDEAADRLIAAIEHEDAHPSKPARRVTPWGDPKKFMLALERKYKRDSSA